MTAGRGLRTSTFGRRAVRATLALALVAGIAGIVVAACGGGGPVGTAAPGTVRPAPTIDAAVGIVRAAIVRALADRSIVVDQARAPYRPAESPALAAAPRLVLQAVLPADPSAGNIVVYGFPDAEAAIAAARSQFAYLSSGPGRVQDPIGTAHVLRQAGSTVIYYAWLPGAARDPLTPAVAEALETIGVAYDIST